MSFFGVDNSGLFNSSGLFGTNSSMSTSFSLGDWNMIRNGSYKRLLTAYYKTENENSDTSKTNGKKGVSVESKQNTIVSGDAGALTSKADSLTAAVKKYASKIGGASDEEKTSLQDELYKAASDYVKAYNTLIDSASESNNTSVLRNAVSITGATKASSKMLSKMGITVGSDNKLSIDEKKFKEADVSDLKTMFTGYGSYSSRISRSAGIINSAATAAVNNERGTSTYTKTGSYSSMVGSISYYNDKI